MGPPIPASSHRSIGPLGVGLLALAALGGGCQAIGPANIQNGRALYNEAIVATNSQQLLAMIVKLRYGEPYGLLAVSAVTANVRIQASTGVNVGIGPSESYAGNLIPLSAAAVYEENPTISYTPLDGEEYIRQLLTPLPLDIALLMIRATNGRAGIFSLLVRSVNGIENPAFLDETGVEVDSRVELVGKHLATLARRDFLEWTETVEEIPTVSMILSGDGEDYEKHVTELYSLLELELPSDLGKKVLEVPVEVGVQVPGRQVMRLRTRSLYDLFQIAAASIDVAADDLASGLAGPLPLRGNVGLGLRIRSSESYPEQAMIAVENHGSWYYLDATDSESKSTFALLQSLMSMLLADTAAGTTGRPLLTVPVSR